jgi:hypothetical protein
MIMLALQYNGCVWKGGKLRLEKAKEHYLDRLKKEWEQDAILSRKLPATDLSTQKEDLEKPNSKHILDSNAKALNIFFPRLRTVLTNIIYSLFICLVCSIGFIVFCCIGKSLVDCSLLFILLCDRFGQIINCSRVAVHNILQKFAVNITNQSQLTTMISQT